MKEMTGRNRSCCHRQTMRKRLGAFDWDDLEQHSCGHFREIHVLFIVFSYQKHYTSFFWCYFIINWHNLVHVFVMGFLLSIRLFWRVTLSGYILPVLCLCLFVNMCICIYLCLLISKATYIYNYFVACKLQTEITKVKIKEFIFYITWSLFHRF